MEILLGLTCALVVVAIVLIIVLRPRKVGGGAEDQLRVLAGKIEGLQSSLREGLRINREENASIAKENRMELSSNLREFRTETTETVRILSQGLREQVKGDGAEMRETMRTVFGQLEERQGRMVETTEKKLEEMRATVDEKLQKTLNERLGQSFELVGKQLENVQKGLGEMQTLAQDVGGLKKVLSNVRMRGGFGEVQLSLLLEQILAPEQYEANVKTKAGSADLVEFAIKLPGQGDGRSVCWIPVDAKFPKDVYEQLQIAHEVGDVVQVELAQKALESTIRKMAKDIRDKYIDPPNTTDFAIIFLPFEGIYAEVVRKASLLEQLQREYKVVVTGPTTLAAILNSLQMGFRSLAIQKRSGEVWHVLGAVKREFESFGGMLEKAQKNLQTASNQIDEVMGKRTRAIQRKLKGVEALNDVDAQLVLPEVAEGDVEEDGE